MTIAPTRSNPTHAVALRIPESTSRPDPNRPQVESLNARDLQRQRITEHLLTALEGVVWRYRTLATHGEHGDLHAEVVTAEVAHQLEVARTALHRHPALS